MRRLRIRLSRWDQRRHGAMGHHATAARPRAGSLCRRLRLTRRRPLLFVLGAILVLPAGVHIAYGLAYLLYSAPWFEHLPFRTGFETGDLSEWSSLGAQQLCCERSAVIVTKPVRSGDYALRMTLDSDDPYVKGSKRAELRLKAAYMGRSYRYAFSLFVPETWTTISDGVMFAQWHSVPDKLLGEGGRVPPLMLVIKGERFELRGTWDDDLIGPTWFSEGGAAAVGKPFFWTAPLERGAWIDWVVDVRWSDDDDGYLELWKDDERVFRRTGPNAFNDILGPYFKMGVYISDWTTRYRQPEAGHDRRSLYFDAVSVTEEVLRRPSRQPENKELTPVGAGSERLHSGARSAVESGRRICRSRNCSRHDQGGVGQCHGCMTDV